MAIDSITRWSGVILVILSLAVSIPLALHTWKDSGGPWGFGVISLPVLVPLSAYILFGIAGMVRGGQRSLFVAAHVITLLIGIVAFIIFPVYPVGLTMIPVVLATVGVINKKHGIYYLLLMIVLGVIANLVLLKWELDFGRTVPLLQLFQEHAHPDP